MNKEKFLRCAVAHLEAELAELNAKNSEIIEAAKQALGDMQGLLNDQQIDFHTGCRKYDGQCADDLSRLVYPPLTQAKGTDNASR